MNERKLIALNDRARDLLDDLVDYRDVMNIEHIESITGAMVLDFGVQTTGGLAAGVQLSKLCMAGLGDVQLGPSPLSELGPVAVQVYTDQPLLACLGSQYGGWPLSGDDYRAIASGPMRLNRGREPVIEKYFPNQGGRKVVGILESDRLPPDAVIEQIAAECQVEPYDVSLCVAPTHSLAGSIQIVARTVEAAMHKLFELDFDLQRVRSGWGTAPLPPVAGDSLAAIGRTNDAILYGAQVQLWIDADEPTLKQLAAHLPSSTSADYGKPFLEILAACNHDFYAIDPMLFGPAQVTLNSTQTGGSWKVGELNRELLAASFQ